MSLPLLFTLNLVKYLKADILLYTLNIVSDVLSFSGRTFVSSAMIFVLILRFMELGFDRKYFCLDNWEYSTFTNMSLENIIGFIYENIFCSQIVTVTNKPVILTKLLQDFDFGSHT